MQNLTNDADWFAEQVERIQDGNKFVIMSERSGKGLPLVAWRLKNQEDYDEFAIARHLRMRGWIVPAYTMVGRDDLLRMNATNPTVPTGPSLRRTQTSPCSYPIRHVSFPYRDSSSRSQGSRTYLYMRRSSIMCLTHSLSYHRLLTLTRRLRASLITPRRTLSRRLQLATAANLTKSTQFFSAEMFPLRPSHAQFNRNIKASDSHSLQGKHGKTHCIC
jgi:hypothetical protein